MALPLAPLPVATLDLTAADRAMLDGARRPRRAACDARSSAPWPALQGATRLVDVTQGHIDGCIYASPANLRFAETMAEMGGAGPHPDHDERDLGRSRATGGNRACRPISAARAQRLADAYVRMGCEPTFTCAPYLLDSAPKAGEDIAWSESNAVIYANTVLAARTVKHPDFLDLCIAHDRPRAAVGRLSGPKTARRAAACHIDLPPGHRRCLLAAARLSRRADLRPTASRC